MIRGEAEIQRAHDILTALTLGELPNFIDEEDQPALHAAVDDLCWVLRHEHNVEFAANLARIEVEAGKLGFVLRGPGGGPESQGGAT